jgi:UDP-arabinose 4-epimerase
LSNHELNSMNVLVTGGAGYIGSHTAKALARTGYTPIVVDNLSTGHSSAVKWGPLLKADLAEEGRIHEIIENYNVRAVIHFAASLLVHESMSNPRKYFWNNVVNTLKLLDVMMETGVKHIVFSSSAAVYGVPEIVPIPEDHPKAPINPYGESKLSMERAIRWYGEAYGISWIALRYFNAAGADLDGEIGEAHDPETHLIPLVIQAALGQRACVEVYGADYPTPDGTAIRDYIHVADLADAHLKALQHLIRGGESQALNLGTGQGATVRQVITSVGRLYNGQVPFRDALRRAGDPPALVADAHRAFSVLNWRPQHSAIDSVVESAWKWHSTPAGLAQTS